MKTLQHFFLSISILGFIGCDAQDHGPAISTPKTLDYSYEIVADSIDIPWGLSMLSATDFLVTEKAGTLYHIVDGVKTTVKGLPPVYVRGQGGLLDVALSLIHI